MDAMAKSRSFQIESEIVCQNRLIPVQGLAMPVPEVGRRCCSFLAPASPGTQRGPPQSSKLRLLSPAINLRTGTLAVQTIVFSISPHPIQTVHSNIESKQLGNTTRPTHLPGCRVDIKAATAWLDIFVTTLYTEQHRRVTAQGGWSGQPWC